MLPRGAQPRPGSRYAVVPRDLDVIAWCPDIAVVLQALEHFRNYDLEVIRLEDNTPIWPWMTRGGSA